MSSEHFTEKRMPMGDPKVCAGRKDLCAAFKSRNVFSLLKIPHCNYSLCNSISYSDKALEQHKNNGDRFSACMKPNCLTQQCAYVWPVRIFFNSHHFHSPTQCLVSPVLLALGFYTPCALWHLYYNSIASILHIL